MADETGFRSSGTPDAAASPPDTATEEQHAVLRARIRVAAEAVSRYVAECPEARDFYEFWGTPTIELD